MSYSPQNPNGQATSANSSPVVLSIDQSDIAVNISASAIQGTPTSNSMAALNAAVQYEMDAGGNYYLTLTNGPGATSAWSGTVTFQYSLNGSTWSSLTVYPVSSPAGSASTATATANGLFFVEAPPATGSGTQLVYIRANMTSYTSGTAYFFIAPQSVPNARVLLPWVYTVTTANTVMGPIEASSLSEISAQISAITTAVYQFQGTNDPTLTTWQVLPTISTNAEAASSVAGISAAGTYRAMINGYKWVRMQCTTTGTVFTCQGLVGTVGQQVVLTSVGNDMGVTVNAGTLPTVTSVTQFNGSAVNMNVTNGSTNKAMTVAVGAATSNTDYNAQNWAAVSGNGATIAPAIGDGQSVSFSVNTTAYTAGSSTGQFVYLQESPDNGTTYMDIWGCEAVTGTGFVRIPPVPIGGRRRMRWVQRAAVATTATVTVTAIGSPGMFPMQRQFFDWGTTGTAANSILITGGAQTTSTSTITSALGTTGQTTAVYPIDGLTQITVKALVSGGTATTAPIVTLQYSDDFSNWVNGTTLTLPASAGMTMTTVNNINARYIRLNLTTAQSGGTAIALTYFSIYGQAI